ncbi:MAG: low molecular weight phosphatase family protein [Microcoleus sp. SIO2G3]|nr:low molecular weight phosphatase family protein [Microcoleus sp. SIO2G3]
MKTLLFLCTGNYYRSRFAEHLFNALAPKHGLSWTATSRGLALERGVNNVGAISKFALTGLTERGVSMALDLRYPLPLSEADLVAASKIIAVDESEHFPLIAERFPKWKDVIEYWLVHDVEYTLPDSALQQIEYNIEQLIEQLPK